MRKRLYFKQMGICKGCNRKVPYNEATIDHIIPKCKGGTNARENCQMMCQGCNWLKGHTDNDEFMVELSSIYGAGI